MGIRNFYKTVPPLFPKCRLQFESPKSSSSSTSSSTASLSSQPSQYEHIALDFNNLLVQRQHADARRICASLCAAGEQSDSRHGNCLQRVRFTLHSTAPRRPPKWCTSARVRDDDADSLRRDLLFYGVRESSASSIELTPGTELMQSVADALSYSACSHLVRSATRLRAPAVAVFVDGSSVAGEGESKIFAHLHARLRDE
jgi:hypothetical protein